MNEFMQRRTRMVTRQIESRGVTDERTLAAMRTVPREQFVPAHLAESAYDDSPLPIGEGQTISQPFMVALMVSSLDLQSTDRVLEIGAGSGYAAAVLSRIAKSVYAVERFATLAREAQQRLHRLGYDNVSVLCADGTLGWPEHAPYDAIMVSAGAAQVPEHLLNQLAIGGRLVIPAGPDLRSQELRRIRRTGEQTFEEESLGRVQFVPLIGSEGNSPTINGG